MSRNYKNIIKDMTFQTRYKGSLITGNTIEGVIELCQEYDDGQGRRYDILDEEIYD